MARVLLQMRRKGLSLKGVKKYFKIRSSLKTLKTHVLPCFYNKKTQTIETQTSTYKTMSRAGLSGPNN